MTQSIGILPVAIDRKQQEADFHDQREIDRRLLSTSDFEAKYSNKKWYSITRASRDYAAQWIRKHCRDAVALDYCCGLGGGSLRLAEAGAFVHGIDISAESVRTASQLLKENGYSDHCQMEVMDAERLSFADNTFDVIYCSGVLHHLDLKQAYRELARVLKPTGRILCIEAVGHNPLIRWYRRRTPHLRTPWEVDHILKRSDVRLAESYFEAVAVRHFHLFSIAAVPMRHSAVFKPVLTACEGIDSIVMRVPGLRWWAWQMVFELSRPRNECRGQEEKGADLACK